MTPSYMQDELGQWHAWSVLRHHYIVGISHNRIEAEARWKEALKVAQA